MSQPTSDADVDAGGSDAVAEAVDAFRRGQPVLIHDFDEREGETDIVYPAGAVTPTDVARLRNDAGGLVCVAVSDGVAETWDLPFLDDALDHPAAGEHELGYDDRSSFSLPVNHRDTYTGITDEDRALTISRLGEAAASTPTFDAEAFAAKFRSPGHVHLLRGAPNLLADRRGHTELGLALADAANLPPAVVVCEMLDDETGQARSKADARAYAERNDFPYLEGAQLLRTFR